MATYTGLADSNGDFTVPFSSNYTSGEKIRVTAEKDGAEKYIEIYAPSEVTGGGVIQFSGNFGNFPQNIGVVTISGEISTIGSYAFAAYEDPNSIWKCASGLVLEEGITAIDSYAFFSWKAGSLSLPETLNAIGDNAFSGWYLLADLIIPDTVRSIGNNTFRDLTGCLSLSIGGGVEAIGSSAFYNLNKIKNLKIPSSVQTIGNNAFQNCTAVESVEIGSGVLSIGSYAFYNLQNCNTFTIKALSPPSAATGFLDNLKSTCIIKVPAGSVAAYQTAPNWSAFASRIQTI